MRPGSKVKSYTLGITSTVLTWKKKKKAIYTYVHIYFYKFCLCKNMGEISIARKVLIMVGTCNDFYFWVYMYKYFLSTLL